MPEMMLMKRLFGRIYFANTREFNEPGVYYCRKVPQPAALLGELPKNWKANFRILPLPQSVARCELIHFPEVTHVIAKNQPQYNPLPAHRWPNDPEGRIVFCYRLNFRARLRVLFGGVIWHQVLTFNRPLQPQLLGTEKPLMQNPAELDPLFAPDYEPPPRPKCKFCGNYAVAATSSTTGCCDEVRRRAGYETDPCMHR